MRPLEQPTLQGVILALLDNTVEFLGSKDHPSSCFTLTVAISCGVDTEPAKLLLRELRMQNQAAIRTRLLEHKLKYIFSRSPPRLDL